MKTIRNIITQVCTRHFDIHDDMSCGKISENMGLRRMLESGNQAEIEMKALIDEEKGCGTCVFVKKVFDGIHGETWTCPKLKKFIVVLNIGMTAQERKGIEFAIKYGFGCISHKPKHFPN